MAGAGVRGCAPLVIERTAAVASGAPAHSRVGSAQPPEVPRTTTARARAPGWDQRLARVCVRNLDLHKNTAAAPKGCRLRTRKAVVWRPRSLFIQTLGVEP